MNLDKIRVAVRPRTASEAIDLGFVMARHWWRPLILSWLMLALPLAIILHLICYQIPWLIGILIWWFKPLYEQAPLYILSRALFDEKTPMKEVAKNLRSICCKQLFANLTWRRLTLRRSFNAPVVLLEGLKGKQRKQRIKVLHGNQPSGGWLTFVCLHLEMVVYFSLFALVSLAIPSELDADVIQILQGDSFWMIAVSNTLYFLAIAAIAPFYVAAGFSLYLHRRIKLEAWDIELDFRKFSQRLQKNSGASNTMNVSSKVATLLLCTVLFTSGISNDVLADETTPSETSQTLNSELAHKQITGILSDPIFGETKTRNDWQYIHSQEVKDEENINDPNWQFENIAELIAFMGEVILWFLAALAIAWIIYKFPVWRTWFGMAAPIKKERYQPPETLFGLDVRPESLPEDIAAEAWQLCQNSEPRAALSLLYRATLIQLINHHHMEFNKGATEGECVTIVQNNQHTASGYFQQLTSIWQAMAYNHQAPATEQLKQLCQGWRQQFKPVEVAQ